MDDQYSGLLVHKAQRLISIVASDVFGVSSLYKEQMGVLTKLAMMEFTDSPTVPAPILFVKATGGGKSLVKNIHSVDIPWRIPSDSPFTCTRGRIKRQKVSTKSIQTCSGDVLAVHLDKIHNPSDQ